MKKLITLLLSFLLVSCTRQELQTRRATYPSKLTIELLTTNSQKPEVRCKLSLEETTRIDKVKVVKTYWPEIDNHLFFLGLTTVLFIYPGVSIGATMPEAGAMFLLAGLGCLAWYIDILKNPEKLNLNIYPAS